MVFFKGPVCVKISFINNFLISGTVSLGGCRKQQQQVKMVEEGEIHGDWEMVEAEPRPPTPPTPCLPFSPAGTCSLYSYICIYLLTFVFINLQSF